MLDNCVIFGGKIGSNTTPFISIFLHTSLIHVHSLLKPNVNEWKSYEYIFLFCYLIRKLSVRDEKFYARNESECFIAKFFGGKLNGDSCPRLSYDCSLKNFVS